MDELLILLVRGVGVGAIYALIAMSFTVVYGSSRILNFAQGNFLILGGLSAALLFGIQVTPLAWLVALPLCALGIGVAMMAQGALTLWPLRSSTEQDSWVITTMAVSVIIAAVLHLSRGPFSSVAASPFNSVLMFGIPAPAPYVVAVLLAVFWYLFLRWFLSRTLPGLAISAISQDQDAARAAGIKVRRLQIIAFGLSGLIIGSAGFVVAPVISLNAEGGFRFVVDGFAALIIGGLGSVTGAAVGGIALGVLGMLATYFFGGEFRSLTVLLVLVVMLTTYPQGLFGFAKSRTV